jgi:hypothetical protein
MEIRRMQALLAKLSGVFLETDSRFFDAHAQTQLRRCSQRINLNLHGSRICQAGKQLSAVLSAIITFQIRHAVSEKDGLAK